MGFLDSLLKPKGQAVGGTPSAPALPVARVFHDDRTKFFDLEQTQTLSDLFATPREQRNAGWQGAFFHAVWTASLELGEPATFHGPDGFNYLRLQLPQPATAFTSNSLGNLARQAVENITGAAIFASSQATEPEYVMSMGVLDSLLTYDSWLGDPVDLNDLARHGTPQEQQGGLQTITTTKDQEVMIGSPNASLLPAHTARGLYQFLHYRWSMAEPRIKLMINPSLAPARSLVISRKLSEFADPATAGTKATPLLWYLPPRRSIILMPESWKQDDLDLLTSYFPQNSEVAP